MHPKRGEGLFSIVLPAKRTTLEQLLYCIVQLLYCIVVIQVIPVVGSLLFPQT